MLPDRALHPCGAPTADADQASPAIIAGRNANRAPLSAAPLGWAIAAEFRGDRRM